LVLERLKKYCSHSAKGIERAVFLVFGFRLRRGYGGQVVSAPLQGFSNLLLRRSLAKNQKSSLRIGHSISLTAPDFWFASRTVPNSQDFHHSFVFPNPVNDPIAFHHDFANAGLIALRDNSAKLGELFQRIHPFEDEVAKSSRERSVQTILKSTI
jgi:hypothetical protein